MRAVLLAEPAKRCRFYKALVVALGVLSGPLAWGYGYDKDQDPLLIAFRAAVKAARAKDIPASAAQAKKVSWQLKELKRKDDLRVDFEAAFLAAHGDEASEEGVIQAWSRLVYLALLQKLHWNLREKVADYHKARARLDAAQTYYELALAGNLRLQDSQRRARDPKARSRHEDIVKSFAAARKALGSPGLFGAGARPADLAAFRQSALRIVGHLKAAFPNFARPEPEAKDSSGR